MHCVIMRAALVFALVTPACATSSVDAPDRYDTVRDRLQEDAPMRLYIGGDLSTGTVTAQRRTAGGWVSGDHMLTIESGALEASLDASGKLEVSAFEVGVAPIDIPEEVFKKPAQLADVRVKLLEATSGALTWTSDDEARARVTMKLDLGWSIAVSGGKTPLGEQHLPAIDVDVTLDGDGDYVGASLSLAATGELWNWANLLQLTHLELQLGAATAN